jgi:predicted kinase
MNFKARFIYWYFNEFQLTELYTRMTTMVEGSPWHRERNVATHTDMVVSQYISFAQDEWNYEDLLGAFACAFHDVGKPVSVQYKHSDARGDYKSFGGHELASARMWENWAVENWSTLTGDFQFVVFDIHRVGWIIEKHLPWAIKKADKLHNLALSGLELFSDEGPIPFTNMVLADTYGRISDDYVEKRQKAHNWVEGFNDLVEGVLAAEAYRHSKKFQNIMYVLIGASGSGKTSFLNTRSAMAEVFSLDALRLEWYVGDKKLPIAEDAYSYAFEKACADKHFKSRANQHFMELVRGGNDIVVDNVNSSKKSRRWYITEARKRDYQIVAMTFPISLEEVLRRQHSRTDKTVPDEAVRRQYMSISTPDYGEFDEVMVMNTNLR